ncbi:MAG: hypothetical protein WC414_04225 [Patescibacteria group bacterium]
MSLVFAAHTPYSSLLVNSIAKESAEKLQATKNALKKIAEELYLARPQILVVICNEKKDDYFSLNAATELFSNFEDFGEYDFKKKYFGANDFAGLIKNNSEMKIKILNEEKNDISISIPLFFIAENLPNTKILVIYTADQTKKNYLEFGKVLKNIFIKSSRRIAILATGNMSHSLKTESPAGFTKEGLEYDKKIIELLEAHNSTGITNLDSDFVKNANESNYHSLLLLLSIIQNMNYEFKNLAYEAPFGVGYLTGYFDFK